MDGHRTRALGLVSCRRPFLRVAAALFFFALEACSSSQEDASQLAGTRSLSPRRIDGGKFDIQTFSSGRWNPNAPLNVYIEGDGYAWIKRDRLSDDPTPKKPIALELAVRDPSPNLVYIARPCQYVLGAARRNCHPAYWSSARYSEEVVSAIDTVIETYRKEAGTKAIRLYGYSGGGTIALLLAARRSDIENVVTVAGILDTEAWTRLLELTPLELSLNPAGFAKQLASVPQIHYVGALDKTAPGEVARAYLARFPETQRPRVITVSKQDHDCCWASIWPSLLSKTVLP